MRKTYRDMAAVDAQFCTVNGKPLVLVLHRTLTGYYEIEVELLVQRIVPNDGAPKPQIIGLIGFGCHRLLLF